VTEPTKHLLTIPDGDITNRKPLSSITGHSQFDR
jgi:hypothetical protein